MKMKRPLSWVPLYVDSWLFGSTRHELTRAQRGDFVDLLLLAAKHDGYIRAAEGVPYPIEQLAGLLCVPAQDLEETIRRCIDTGKVELKPDKTLYVCNWEKYRLTRQYRGRLEHEPPSALPQEENSKGKVEESKGKGNIVSQNGNNKDSPPENDDEGLLPVPERLPFEASDELVNRRAEIRRLSRLLADGKHQDGEHRISQEQLERKRLAFNERVRDLT